MQSMNLHLLTAVDKNKKKMMFVFLTQLKKNIYKIITATGTLNLKKQWT